MRKVQVRGEIGPDVANWPVASSKTRNLRRTTTVRMNVARSEPMFSTPILAKIAVRAANTADRSAHSCQDLAVVAIRAAGTAVGDFISGRNMLGLPVSTAVTGILFVVLLLAWKEPGRSERAAIVNR
jgi:uncharacterized membrane-anchored protein